MKIRMGLALLVLAALGVGIIHGQQTQRTSYNGYWWLPSTEQFKLGFATGYATAMTGAADAASFRCLAAKNGGTIPEKYPGKEALEACLQTPEVKALSFGNIRIGQLVDGVDDFYKDFLNKGIEVQLAMRYVRDRLKGKTDQELADELAGWRKSANK